MNKVFMFIPLAAGLLLGGTGCVSRELVAFNDHADKPLTAMRVIIRKNYIFSKSSEFVYYSCSENGDKLDCKRLCGGDKDIVCPGWSDAAGHTSNSGNVK